jgi:hypothetical protein
MCLGAFNICARMTSWGPIDLAKLVESRRMPVPPALLRVLIRVARTLWAIPADLRLFDAVMGLPVMSNTRAKSELGWRPTRAAEDVLKESAVGLREGTGSGLHRSRRISDERKAQSGA